MIIIAYSNGNTGGATSWEMLQGGGSALNALEVSTPCLLRQLVCEPAIALFVTQRDHRLYLHRPPRRHVTRQYRHGYEHCRNRSECQRTGRAHAEQ